MDIVRTRARLHNLKFSSLALSQIYSGAQKATPTQSGIFQISKSTKNLIFDWFLAFLGKKQQLLPYFDYRFETLMAIGQLCIQTVNNPFFGSLYSAGF